MMHRASPPQNNQNGTRHAWENRGAVRTHMAFFHVAAEFGAELRASLGMSWN